MLLEFSDPSSIVRLRLSCGFEAQEDCFSGDNLVWAKSEIGFSNSVSLKRGVSYSEPTGVDSLNGPWLACLGCYDRLFGVFLRISGLLLGTEAGGSDFPGILLMNLRLSEVSGVLTLRLIKAFFTGGGFSAGCFRFLVVSADFITVFDSSLNKLMISILSLCWDLWLCSLLSCCFLM